MGYLVSESAPYEMYSLSPVLLLALFEGTDRPYEETQRLSHWIFVALREGLASFCNIFLSIFCNISNRV